MNHNYILSGSTGILGSHILYELMMNIHLNDYHGSIVLLIREKNNVTLKKRLKELFKPELVPDFLLTIDFKRIIKENITLIKHDLVDEQLNLEELNNDIKYTLIHSAASVNLGTNQSTTEEIQKTNYIGTFFLIKKLAPFTSQITYISTAFSSGHQKGLISNYFNFDSTITNYRNPYEEYKSKTESELISFCTKNNIKHQIIRPSIICGRLYDTPLFVIPKFLVFYLFGAFFLRFKESHGQQHIRIAMNKDSGLNLIPVDYAAKAIIKAIETDLTELTIASNKCLPNKIALPQLLKQVGWTSFEIITETPDNLNHIEQVYYKTVGDQLNNYLSTPVHEFDVTVLNELMQDYIKPDLSLEFENLVKYAVDNSFISLID
jgi:thioester reductase-like protein